MTTYILMYPKACCLCGSHFHNTCDCPWRKTQ